MLWDKVLNAYGNARASDLVISNEFVGDLWICPHPHHFLSGMRPEERTRCTLGLAPFKAPTTPATAEEYAFEIAHAALGAERVEELRGQAIAISKASATLFASVSRLRDLFTPIDEDDDDDVIAAKKKFDQAYGIECLERIDETQAAWRSVFAVLNEPKTPLGAFPASFSGYATEEQSAIQDKEGQLISLIKSFESMNKILFDVYTCALGVMNENDDITDTDS